MSHRASTAWLPADDQKLMEERSQGRQWGVISRQFSNKSANACRKRYGRLLQRRNQEELEGEAFDLIAQAYMLHRHEIWGPFAEQLREHLGQVEWEQLEKKLFEKGLKTIKAASERASRRDMDPPFLASVLNPRGGQMMHDDAILSSGVHLDSALGCSLMDGSSTLERSRASYHR